MPALRLDKRGEHTFGIDGQESAAAAGQHFTFLIQNLCAVEVAPSPDTNLSRLNPQRLVQWHRLQIIHRNLRGQRDHLAQLVYFSHGFIKDSSDNPAMAMSRRTGIFLAQPKVAYETITLAVINEFQAHAVDIVSTAGKAVVLL